MALGRHLPRLIELLEAGLRPGPRPPSVADAIALAREGGRQPAIGWPRDRWIRSFPSHRGLFEELPDALRRDDVRAVVRQRTATPRGAVECFLTTMAWGYGQTGYGVHRTKNILHNPEAANRLAAAREAVGRSGPLAGYRALADGHRLPGLGPAFGTKFLFFLDEDALILDRLIADWYASATGEHVDPVAWHTKQYERYLRRMQEWAGGAGRPAHRLEEAAFTLVAAARGNQWAPADDD